MKRRTFIASAMGAIAGTAGCARTWQEPLHSGAALAFGTTISISVAHPDAQLAQRAIGDALQAALAVDRLMSIYNPSSQVFRLNRDGRLKQPDARLLDVLTEAKRLSELSGGAFDVTTQPLWLLYTEAAKQGRLPGQDQRRRAQALVNWRDLAFDSDSVRFLRPGMALTLNGLAQGYAADRALAALQAHGVQHALLDTGEYAARGEKPGHRPWVLGVRDPRDPQGLVASLRARGCSVATSGDYACTFTPDFRHHHIFDPVRGASPDELASVTVVAPSALLADGLSTSFMVLGWERARALAAQLPAVDLLAVDKLGRLYRTAGFPAGA